MKSLSLILVSLGLSVSVSAQTVSIKERLAAADFYKTSFDTLFKEQACRRPEDLLAAIQKLPSKSQTQARKFIQLVEGVVPEKLLMPLVYHRFIKKSEKSQALVIQHILQTRIQILRDYSENPLNINKSAKAQAQTLLEQSSRRLASLGAESAVRGSDVDLYRYLQSIPELSSSLKSSIPDIEDYSLTAMGLIPGNQVELVSENRVDPERIKWLNERSIFAGGSLDFTQPYMKMPLSPMDEGHPVFKEDPMFRKIRDMIIASKDSVFIDIFLFGGTMGGTLSKFLLDQTIEKKKANPHFQVLILHDFATNYNMKDEMMPVFRYIRDRIASEPVLKESVYMLQANIQRHPPGIPFGLTNLVPKTDETFKALEKRNTYYESKIDHSKVIVIDAELDEPQAYFGSKNWSDHSGGYYYDNALFVKGPAAAVVQAAYYDDVEAALTLDKTERKWMFFKEEGFSNEAYLPRRDKILSWFKVKRTSYPAVGDQAVRLAEANVDGKIKDTRNMLVDMISKAESHIYMEHLFIYDKYINDALIKRKAQVPSLKVRILADHNGNFNLGGLPNTIYLDQLLKHGVEVKARKTLGIHAEFKDGTSREYHQENHRKITSVDGKTLLVGSSNLNPDTLQGSFREFGAQIYDTKVIAGFESKFAKDWNDKEQTGPFYEGDRLQLKVMGRTLSPEQSALLNNIGAAIFRSKDDIEKR
ncbi:cardiolipin synthetase [compost metagenome]